MDAIHFDVRFATVTGSVVWDQPDANRMIQRFMPSGREHGPMIGILHIGAFRPTPNVLMDAIVTFGEDLRAGRYGNFTLVVSSSDEATRTVVSNIASAHNVAMFVSPSPDSPSPTHLA